MGLQVWKRWLVTNGVIALLAPAVFVSAASADDEEVGRRLAKYGKLSGAEARKLAGNVSGRMKRAADMANQNDPLRAAVSTALYKSPAPPDAMGAAKVRLRLYAGLNEWALDALFAPRPGALATCTQQYGLRGQDCEALLAAAGRMSPSEASRVGGGKPIATAAAAPVQQAPAGYGQAAPAQGSRFGRYDSGFRGAPPQQQQPSGYGPARPAFAPARPAYGAYGPGQFRPQQQPAYGGGQAYGAQQQPAYAAQPARPMAYNRPAPAAGYGYQRPMPAAQPARPVAAPRPLVAPPPSPAMVANRKAEYERKRQEYLERKKAEMQARKSKIVATAGGTQPVQRGLLSAEQAAAVGVDPSTAPARAPEAAPAAKAPAKGASAKAAPAEAAPEEVAQAPAAEPAKSEEKPALDNDFLDGLMDNPLGKK